MSCVCPADWPSCVAKTLTLDVTRKLLKCSINFFMPAMLIGTAEFSYITFTDLDLLTRSAPSKTYWLHFLAYFSSDQDKVWCGCEAIQAEHIEATFEQDFFKQGE